MNLVTLDQAKGQLQMDHDDDDTLIAGLVSAASDAVLDYLKGAPIGEPERDEQGAVVKDSDGDIVYEQDSDGDIIIRGKIQQATLILIAEWYRNRDAEQSGAIEAQWGFGYLPRPVVALLYSLRDPALA